MTIKTLKDKKRLTKAEHFYLILAINLLCAAVLALITLNALHLAGYKSPDALDSWLIYSPTASLIGMIPAVLLFLVFLLDSLWILFFVVWLIRRKFNIKSKNNTLYLP